MKKKWPIRVLLMLLCMVMLCNIPVYAAEARASDRIYHSAASLSKKSDGDLSIYFSVRATDVMEKIGASSVAVQRSSGSNWVTEYTFTTSNTPTLQKENKDQYGRFSSRAYLNIAAYGLIGRRFSGGLFLVPSFIASFFPLFCKLPLDFLLLQCQQAG